MTRSLRIVKELPVVEISHRIDLLQTVRLEMDL